MFIPPQPRWAQEKRVTSVPLQRRVGVILADTAGSTGCCPLVLWSLHSMIQKCLLGTYCMQGSILHVGETPGICRGVDKSTVNVACFEGCLTTPGSWPWACLSVGLVLLKGGLRVTHPFNLCSSDTDHDLSNTTLCLNPNTAHEESGISLVYILCQVASKNLKETLTQVRVSLESG